MRAEAAGYAEIAAHYRQQIQDGVLQPGDTMPSMREVGQAFGVAQTTVNRAFRVLKQEGLTTPKAGVGTVVAEPERTSAPSIQDSIRLLSPRELDLIAGERANRRLRENHYTEFLAILHEERKNLGLQD